MSIETLENFVKNTWEAGRPIEGSIDEVERKYLANLARNTNVKLIGEVGFNAGLSSYTFLEANPKAQVYSFDIGEYDYVKPAKKYINELFPDRHNLIFGDSLKTVPKLHGSNPELKFDLIFIDGGHDYKTVKADINNMKNLATKDTLLLIDDLTPWKSWGVGPTKAWLEAIDSNFISQLELYKDGNKASQIEPPGERSWAIGKYIFD